MAFFSKKKRSEDGILDFTINQEDMEKDLVDNHYLHTKSQKLQYVENNCEQIIVYSKKIEESKRELDAVNKQIEDVLKIENMPPVAKENLKRTAKRILNLKKDKKSYKKYSSEIPENIYDFISNNEYRMPDILKDMKDNEDDCQTLKTNLNIIDGEKSGLKYERKAYAFRLRMLRKILFIIIPSIILITLTLLYAQYNSKSVDYKIYIYIAIIVGLIASTIILFADQYTRKKLMITELKMNKSIGLINKYKLRYVNSKATIDYLYKEYNVHNSYELSNLWRLFINAKKEREAYFKMSDELYKEIENYNSIINRLGLYDNTVWNYQIGAITDEKEMEEMKHKLFVRRDQLNKIIDNNESYVNKSKDKIRKIIEKDPGISKEVISIIDKKEKEALR